MEDRKNNISDFDLQIDNTKQSFPKYEVARISGTTDKLGEIPIIYPETEVAYRNILPSDSKLKPSNEKTPYLEPSNVLRIFYQRNDLYKGVRDPREPFNDTPDSPSGLVQLNVNVLTNEVEVTPKTIIEPFLTATLTPYGPIRESESTLRRKNVDSMYGLTNTIVSEIGADSNGKIIFSDGNSFLERCIFTGYDKSFMPIKSWKPRQQTKPVNKQFTIESKDGKIVGRWDNGEVVLKMGTGSISFPVASPPETEIPHVFLSKSGYYFTRRPPIKSMFLGYNDADITPDSATFWETPRNGKKHFYNDRICENELNVQMSTVLSTFPTLVTKPKDYPLLDKEQVLYSKENKSLNYPQGSYRSLLNNLSKIDIVDLKRMKNGVETPVLRRRVEQYGPNPLQHLYYMDFFDWRKYTTTYIQEDENTIDIFAFKKPVDYLTGKYPISENRLPFIDNIFNSGNRGRFQISQVGDTYFFTDTTPILDIYFGLMEMHLKSFSWEDIFSIVDSIPDMRSQWNDPSWQNLSYEEKSKIRFSEIDQQLQPVWEIIKQALDNTNQ